MLIYTGGMFGGSVAGVPARDLSDEEVERYGGEAMLVATGLYIRMTFAPPPKKIVVTRGAIDLRDGVSDDEARLAGQALSARKEKRT